MAYATEQDLIDAYGARELAQLTDEAGETIDGAAVARALDAASAEADTYLARRVTTPLDPAPPTLRLHVLAIARHHLHKDHTPERVAAGYKAALDWLRLAASGVVSVDGRAPAPDAPSADMPLVDAAPRIFGRDAMRGL